MLDTHYSTVKNLLYYFCVGEELPIRESGTHVSHVIRQIRASLEGFTKPELKKIVIAYEPSFGAESGMYESPE